MAKKPTRNQDNNNSSQNNNENNDNQSGNTNNQNNNDPSQNADVITIEKPYGLCGRCGWKPDGDKSYKNYCPMCKKTGTLIIHKSKSNSGKTTQQTEISCRGPGGCGADFCGKCGDELDGTHRSKLTPADGQIGDSPTDSNASGIGGSAIKIPDKTFYGLINQICGAVDAVFIPANNLAYLLSFKDYYKYREENDDLIPIITPKDVIDNSIEYEWDTQGFYNSVEVSYKDGKLKYKHDTLIAQYGENTFYYEFENDDYETAKAKAAALLSAHVRDYGTDIKLTCLYNENITVGGWVKIQKTIFNTTNKMEQNKTKKVKHAGTIEDMYEMMQDNIYGDKKVYQIYKKDKVETNQTEYELFFVQGYNIRWSKKYTMTMDIHLKYGPDTPNDPINATIGVGGAASGGGSAGVQDGEGITEDIKQQVAEIIGNETDPLKKCTMIHEWLRENLTYSRYDCMRQKSPSDCLKSKHINCADTAQLTCAMMTCAGLDATVVHGPHHFWTVITINGKEYASDATSKRRHLGDVWKGMSYYAKTGQKPSC